VEIKEGGTMGSNQPMPGEQAALWNDAGGRGWVTSQDLIDQVLRPFEDLLVDAIASEPTSRALDVGCGTGGTTVAVARRLGARGGCTGIDISEPMVAAARARAQGAGLSVDFIVADAQRHPFERAGFDAIFSRFGVMFFDDSVEAFTNLHHSARTGARLRFVVWRSAAENPFMTTAERAAAPLLPHLPARRPDEPGQFALADRDRVRRILEESGWSRTDIQPLDVPCALPESALVRYLSHLGPVGRALQQADDTLRARVLAAVRPAFDPYVQGTDVRFTAACWMASARA
jgi:SAM-dependent methyltransferase